MGVYFCFRRSEDGSIFLVQVACKIVNFLAELD